MRPPDKRPKFIEDADENLERRREHFSLRYDLLQQNYYFLNITKKGEVWGIMAMNTWT